MSFSQIAYQALQDTVGPENVSDDAVVCQGYSRVNWLPLDFSKEKQLGTDMRPVCVVMPGSAEEVQSVVSGLRIGTSFHLSPEARVISFQALPGRGRLCSH